MNINDPKFTPDPLNDPTPNTARPSIEPDFIDSTEETAQTHTSSKTFEEKVRDNLRNARGANTSDYYDYSKHTKEQVITYSLLIIGFLLLFVNTIIGGLLIGAVAGYYFTQDIVYYLRNITTILKGHDHLRYVTLTVLLIGLLLTSPGIFVGAAIVAAFKQLMDDKPTL